MRDCDINKGVMAFGVEASSYLTKNTRLAVKEALAV
jgi:hypothetical protein